MDNPQLRRNALALWVLLGLLAGTNLGAVLDNLAGAGVDPALVRALAACPTCGTAAAALAGAMVAANRWLLVGAVVGLAVGGLAYALAPKPGTTATAPARTSGRRWGLYLLIGLAAAGLVLRAVTRTGPVAQPAATPTLAPTLTLVPLPAPAMTLAAAPTEAAAPENTPLLPPTASPAPAQTATPGPTPACADISGLPAGLLTYLDREVALERDFEPDDLAEVPLEADNLRFQAVTLRELVHLPLLAMIAAMNEAGLIVTVVSGYRSYTEQVLAHEKWQTLYPDRAPEISAVPGHSEHQLGTAVDFSTPDMNRLYGESFHQNFSKTPEGQWLIQHAAAYGFTLSYPAWATEATGYAWEPWHFRYVGRLALELTARNLTLTQYLRQCPVSE